MSSSHPFDHLAAHLPLRPVEALLLTMLSAGDRHGYGLRRDILDHSGGKIALEAGSLYRHIRRLLIGVAMLLAGVAALASWIPARRAVAVSPTEALRGGG